jgi:sugar lactone lactonase YvrE
MQRNAAAIVLLLCVATPIVAAQSIYTERPPDPKAVLLQPGAFGAVGDGVADDTAALQRAINAVQESTVRGVVLIAAGRYRLTETVHVWAGIRLIGFGAERPVFVLGESTPGFQGAAGDPSRYMIHFTSSRPREGEPIRDANPGTFYSALGNIDFEIGSGNPIAVGVRSHFAQHCFIAHAEFRLASGRAGVEAVGNEIDACRFVGGDFGILTRKPSPSWPFVLIDSTFAGQRVAAISTEEAGMTIVRGRFENVPAAVVVNPERSEELYIRDSRFARISGPALVISEEANARTQVNVIDSSFEDVPVLARLRESGRETAAPGKRYIVRSFSHGLHQDSLDAAPRIETRVDAVPVAELPPPVPSDVPRVPLVSEWHSIADSGATGNGTTDDTAAIRTAIAKHRVVFFPAGLYRVSDTIELREDSVLIGLNPITSQIALADESPAFLGGGAERIDPAQRRGWRANFPVGQGTGGPKPLLDSARGGAAIVTGLGLDTGRNDRAVALRWRAGADSLVNDVRFLGGHGTYLPDGTSVPVYNDTRTGDGDPRKRWDSQYWSLWVTDGGGGTFKNLWTPSPYAMAGMLVSDTSTPGRVYAMSAEHHVRAEVQLRRVKHWMFFALQFEEERAEGPQALPLGIDDCEDLEFANLYLYRVMSTYSPYPAGVVVRGSRDIRFRGVHAYGPSKFTVDSTFIDADSGRRVLSREIARLDITGDETRAPETDPCLMRLAGGFNNIDGFAVDRAGNLLFVDARWQRIHRFDAATGTVRVLRDAPLEPVALACAANGEVLAVTRVGTVFAFDPDARGEEITVIAPQPARARPNATAILPVSRWRDSHDYIAADPAAAPWHYVSPDGSIFIPAGDDFVNAGYMRSFFSTIDPIRAYGLAPTRRGEPFYVADEFGQRVFSFEAGDDGTLRAPQLFAEEGEAAVAVGPDGNVYVAAGWLFVYAPDGRELERIEVPARPTALAFGGANGRTLFIGARDQLFSLDVD